LLSQIGVATVQLIPNVDEASVVASDVQKRIVGVAKLKAQAGLALLDNQSEALPLLAADTAVVCDNIEMGKPKDRDHARQMLRRLSATSHWVYTAVIVMFADHRVHAVGATKVWFKEMNNNDIESYCDSNEPFDKAGGYGIQGRGAMFVERIEGSYSNVVGLPLFETAGLLRSVGLKL
jgi:septum formation protein